MSDPRDLSPLVVLGNRSQPVKTEMEAIVSFATDLCPTKYND